MGTSSSRKGKVTNKVDSNGGATVTWASAKSSATRFYGGNGSFGIAMQKVILASGGRDKFAGIKRTKKIKAMRTLLGFFEIVKSIGFREALLQSGAPIDESKTNHDLIIDYINNVVYPDTVTYSDTSNREELSRFALKLYDLFDSNVMASEENQAILNAIKDIVCDAVTNEINNSFEEEVPLSLENENVQTTLDQIDVAKSNIRKKVDKYSKIYVLKSDSADDIAEYEHSIYNAVLDDFYSGEFDDE